MYITQGRITSTAQRTSNNFVILLRKEGILSTRPYFKGSTGRNIKMEGDGWYCDSARKIQSVQSEVITEWKDQLGIYNVVLNKLEDGGRH